MADLSILQEPLSDRLKREMLELADTYFTQTDAHKDLPPLDMKWETYETLKQLGMLVIFTAREEGKLLGFNMYAVTEHPHHRGCLMANCDALSVRLDARSKGVGRKLVDYATPRLREMGVQRMVHHERQYNNRPALFETIPGFRLADRVYWKDLSSEESGGTESAGPSMNLGSGSGDPPQDPTPPTA